MNQSRRSMRLLGTGLVLLPTPAFAVCPACPNPDPVYAYKDADNDGCYTVGVDSGSIEDLLIAGFYEAPQGTGIVVPRKPLRSEFRHVSHCDGDDAVRIGSHESLHYGFRDSAGAVLTLE